MHLNQLSAVWNSLLGCHFRTFQKSYWAEALEDLGSVINWFYDALHNKVLCLALCDIVTYSTMSTLRVSKVCGCPCGGI